MKEYRPNIAHTVPTDRGRIERAHVDSYVRGGGERAYATYGQLVYAKTEDEKAGLYVRLFCKEKNPVSKETQPDGMVCRDSCMEFFFGLARIDAKTEMRGNFYKCDENAGAPFGSWAPVTAPAPDFHRPECFGRILLTE